MVKTKSIKPKEKRTIVSNKKRDRDQFIKEMDMIRLKQKINEIMKKVSNDKSKIENNNTKYQKNIQLKVFYIRICSRNISKMNLL